MTLLQLGIAIALGSLVLPTLAYIVQRLVRPAPRPVAAKLAGWMCMWIGQLGVPLSLVALHCVHLTFEWQRRGAPTAAFVYGAAMAVVTAFITLLALQTFFLGPVVLGAGTDEAVDTRARGLLKAALAAVIIVTFYVVVVMRFVPMPGREWVWLFYIAGVIVPAGLVASLIAVLALTLRQPPWLTGTGGRAN